MKTWVLAGPDGRRGATPRSSLSRPRSGEPGSIVVLTIRHTIERNGRTVAEQGIDAVDREGNTGGSNPVPKPVSPPARRPVEGLELERSGLPLFGHRVERASNPLRRGLCPRQEGYPEAVEWQPDDAPLHRGSVAPSYRPIHRLRGAAHATALDRSPPSFAAGTQPMTAEGWRVDGAGSDASRSNWSMPNEGRPARGIRVLDLSPWSSARSARVPWASRGPR